jgi:hypothetical protein
MRSPAAGLRLAGVLAALLATACRPPEAFRVGAVRAAPGFEGAALGETGLDAHGIEASAVTALAATGFRLGETGTQVATVGVTSLRVVPGAAGPLAEVKVEIALGQPEPGPGPRRHEAGVGTSPMVERVPSPRAAWGRALDEATLRAAEALAIGARADAKSEDGLVADLGSRDERVRDHAVRALGERRSRKAVPALVARLRSEDAQITMRIVGALAQIGDEQAVPALIDLSRGVEPLGTARLARFIGDIGGAEAEAYLATLESGSPDPRIREAARAALEELTARSRVSAKMPRP